MFFCQMEELYPHEERYAMAFLISNHNQNYLLNKIPLLASRYRSLNLSAFHLIMNAQLKGFQFVCEQYSSRIQSYRLKRYSIRQLDNRRIECPRFRDLLNRQTRYKRYYPEYECF